MTPRTVLFSILAPLSVAVAVLSFVQIVVTVGLIPAFLVPTPTRVLQAMVEKPGL